MCVREYKNKKKKEWERETVCEREMTLPMGCHNLASSGRQKDRQRSLLPADGYRVHDQRGIQRCRLHTDQSVLNIPLRETQRHGGHFEDDTVPPRSRFDRQLGRRMDRWDRRDGNSKT